MQLLEEVCCSVVNWSIGMVVLIAVTSSHFNGLTTLAALPLAATGAFVSGLCHQYISNLVGPEMATLKKRRFLNLLEFVLIWTKIFECLCVTAISARMASATIDHISNSRIRELFLGLESFSMDEPWPDLFGIGTIVVVTALFMLGLEKSICFSALLLFVLFVAIVICIVVGSSKMMINLSNIRKWFDNNNDGQQVTLNQMLQSAALCYYGFNGIITTTFKGNKTSARFILILIPLIGYTIMTIILNTMFIDKPAIITSTFPFLKILELEDMHLIRLLLSICVIIMACLNLTEVLPHLYCMFFTLSASNWQIFPPLLQYKSHTTDTPVLTIFVAGSFSAILTFTCPLYYLIYLVGNTALLNSVFLAIQLIYHVYRPEFDNDEYFQRISHIHYYNRLDSVNTTNFIQELRRQMSDWGQSTMNAVTIMYRTKLHSCDNPAYNTRPDNCSLLGMGESNVDEKDAEPYALQLFSKKSIHFEDDDEELTFTEHAFADDESTASSVDVDVVIQEYTEQLKISSSNDLHRKTATQKSFVTVMFLLTTSIGSVLCFVLLSNIPKHIPLLVILTANVIIILMPIRMSNNIASDKCMSCCALFCMNINTVLISTIINHVWAGLLFWIISGSVLFWRCQCCTCEDVFDGNNIDNKLLSFGKTTEININGNYDDIINASSDVESSEDEILFEII